MRETAVPSRRTTGRQRTLELLYEAAVKQVDARELLATDEDPFVAERVHAVELYRVEVDDLIARHVIGWQPERLAPIDRALLRLATAEILARLAPVKVAIAEAVKLADTFSTERSATFVNGVLGAILADLRSTPLDSDHAAD